MFQYFYELRSISAKKKNSTMSYKVLLIMTLSLTIISTVSYAENTLSNDLEEIFSQVPIQKVKAVVLKYYFFDSEVREFRKYLMGEEFKKIWLEVFQLKTVQNLIKFLENMGVDVHG